MVSMKSMMPTCECLLMPVLLLAYTLISAYKLVMRAIIIL